MDKSKKLPLKVIAAENQNKISMIKNAVLMTPEATPEPLQVNQEIIINKMDETTKSDSTTNTQKAQDETTTEKTTDKAVVNIRVERDSGAGQIENKKIDEKPVKNELPVSSTGPIRLWDQKENLVFLHIGKAGGTSFDSTMISTLKKSEKEKFYVGGKHFDWTWIEDKYPTANVLILFREPVSRAFSHFNFMKGKRCLLLLRRKNISFKKKI